MTKEREIRRDRNHAFDIIAQNGYKLFDRARLRSDMSLIAIITRRAGHLE